MGKPLKKLMIAALWLLIWQGAAVFVHNSILLVGPWDTAKALWQLLGQQDFWLAVGNTLLHIALGFLSGGAVGILLAALSYASPLFREILSPFIRTVKAVPVVSFVIMALIWFTSRRLSLFVTLTVVGPIFYFNTLEGLLATDRKLLELAKVYHMGLGARIRGIYLPQLRSTLTSAVELAVGMAWKSGLAAEVIGQPVGSLGNTLYRAKIYLETDKVLAVTVTAVFLSWALGKLTVRILRHEDDHT